EIAVVGLLTALGVFAVNAGFPSWHGGWCTGPRFLTPLFPLAALAVGVWLAGPTVGKTARSVHAAAVAVWLAAGGVSLWWVTVCNVAGARIPQDVPRPVAEYAGPLLSAGRVEPHVGDWILRAVAVTPSDGWPGAVAAVGVTLAAGVAAWLVAKRSDPPATRSV
ncbi:MAG: hypothetical protein ACRC1K_13565, partial [Planctomycetia bacterium]